MHSIRLFRYSIAIALSVAASPLVAGAQTLDQECGDVIPFSQGDGRIHSGPALQVACMDLTPGQVTTINLHPRFHTTLQFHAPVARVDAGDPDVFRAEIVGNKIMLKAIEVDPRETSMTIILGDAQQTLVPFLIRADSMASLAFVIKFENPLITHLNRTEREIATRLGSNVDRRVEQLAEARIQQTLLYRSGAIPINRRATTGSSGERIGLIIEEAEQLPGPGGAPRLHVRYRILNETPIPLSDAHFVSRIDTHKRRLLFFKRTTSMELTHEEVRTSNEIPAGASVRGLLILDGVELAENQSLSLELAAFEGRRTVRMDRVLVGSK